jgi:hypothetical protein
MIPHGFRTWAFCLLTLGFLFAGLSLSLWYPVAGAVLFGTYAAACVVVAGIAAGRNLGQDLAGGGGLKGAVSALLTDKKPEAKP